jgi:hypothetical protein
MVSLYSHKVIILSQVRSHEFQESFDIPLEKMHSGVAKLRHAMLYGKSQFNFSIDSWMKLWD